MDLLPTVPFGEARITRLIIGGNPFRGNSHFSREMDRDMESFFTVERIKQTLFACERNGINTVQARGDVLIQACIREYRAEGGTMQFIVQTASELRDLPGHVKGLAQFGALGIYVHGTFTDRHFLAGTIDEVEDLLKRIRDSGVQAGLCTHMPEVIDFAEDQGWDFDFYMASLYNLTGHRPERESALVAGAQSPEAFDHDDKWPMFERIRATDKTCLAFKVLGANRLCGSPEEVRSAFEVALTNIKPTDAIVVGMFPKLRDQAAENARFFREILAGQTAESTSK